MKNVRTAAKLACVAAGLLFVPALQAAAVYSFLGTDYTGVAGGFTTSMSLTGTFTLTSPLAPNVVSPATVTPVSFSFSDGVDTYDQSNTTSLFEFTTGSSANITGWVIDFRNGGIPACAISAQNIVVTHVLGATCENDTLGLSQHTEVISDALAQYNAALTSDSSIQGTITPVPEPSPVVLLLMGVMTVLATGTWGRRFRAQAGLCRSKPEATR